MCLGFHGKFRRFLLNNMIYEYHLHTPSVHEPSLTFVFGVVLWCHMSQRYNPYQNLWKLSLWLVGCEGFFNSISNIQNLGVPTLGRMQCLHTLLWPHQKNGMMWTAGWVSFHSQGDCNSKIVYIEWLVCLVSLCWYRCWKWKLPSWSWLIPLPSFAPTREPRVLDRKLRRPREMASSQYTSGSNYCLGQAVSYIAEPSATLWKGRWSK